MKRLILGLNNKAYVRLRFESVTTFNNGRRGNNAPPVADLGGDVGDASSPPANFNNVFGK